MNSLLQASLPPASLIICSFNRPKLLAETVESVLRGDEVPTEIVIIDQSDIPHPVLASLKSDRSCEIRYLWTHSVGLSRARNTGIAAARHAILAIIDDDMLVESAWFGSLIRALLNAGERAVVTGRVLPTVAEVPGGFVPTFMPSQVPAVYEGRIGTDVLAGGHMAARRSIFDAVGGFDERLGAGADFPAADDNDLGFRLLEAGYRIIYAPEAVLYHRAWRGKGEYMAMRWSYGRGKGGYYGKYLGRKDGLMLCRMSRDILHRVFRFPLLVWLDPRRACGDLVYIAGILSGTTRWTLTQLKEQTNRRVRGLPNGRDEARL
jgi:O-antigen biosynthesis protein